MTDLEIAQLAYDLLEKIIDDMDIEYITFHEVLTDMVELPDEEHDAVVEAAERMWAVSNLRRI